MSENENVGEDHPARTDDDHVKAQEEAAEAGTEGGGPAEPGSEATGSGPSGGAESGGAGGGDSSATGAGPSGGAR